jgi:hypothetical protein
MQSVEVVVRIRDSAKERKQYCRQFNEMTKVLLVQDASEDNFSNTGAMVRTSALVGYPST